MTDLQRYLADHDAACPGCGYNLRSQPSGTCPECGKTFSLEELTHPRLPGVAYMFGVIGLSLFACWAGLASLGLFISRMALPALVLIAVAGLPLWWWHTRETWIRTRTEPIRLCLAFACWAGPLAAMVAISACLPSR